MSNVTITKAVADPEVDAAFAAEGYVLADGGRDIAKMRATAYEAFRPAKALSRGERDAKAITRNALITRVFPNLTVPSDTGPQAMTRTTDAADLMAIAVWKEVDRLVWELTKPGPGGPFQRMVMGDLGNGYVVCRYKAGVDKNDAAYVTDDFPCIAEDYIGPDNAAGHRFMERTARKRAMLAMLRPADQERILRGYDQFTERAVTAGRDAIVEAIEATRPSDGADHDDESDEV